MLLEEALGMSTGYVAGFTNREFQRFVYEVLRVDVYDTTYSRNGQSKANRLRALFSEASDHEVALLLEALHRHWELIKPAGAPWEPPSALLDVARRLRSEAVDGPCLLADDVEDALSSPVTGDEFTALVSAVREAVDRNEPATGLDRLHTYMTKLFRALCDRHAIEYERSTSLNSLAGSYIRRLQETQRLESPMTGRILKGTVRILQDFNDVRNNHSLAHANELLGHDESMLIIGHVSNLVRYVSSIEESLPMVAADADE